MNIRVQGITAGKYAFLRRTNTGWKVSYEGKESKVRVKIPDSMKLNEYRILGIDNDLGRVIRFADLHRHSDNSLLDGMTKVGEMVERTEYAGALTDHGNMYGFLEFYKKMLAAGKHPIIGFEAYMADMDDKLNRNHLVLLAKNDAGVKNLFKLTSESFEHFYMKPHVTWDTLEKYHEGVIVLTACIAGAIPQALLKHDLPKARQILDELIRIFGKDDVYVEIQRHGIHEEDLVYPQLIHLAEDAGVKVVATTDSHYPTKEDASAHEILLCMQTNALLSDADHYKFNGTGYHLHTSDEMEELFKDYPQALDNTLELAEKCHINIKLKDVNLPKYEIPKEYNSPSEYMVDIATKGYHERYGGTEHENDPVYLDRFNYEINMIKRMGFESYFIVVWDFISYCKTHNIYVGPGRGSAAGSIVAYCMGITDIDPIKYNLLFERFLNPERVSWPDIDTDIEFSKRPEVINYLIHKYGAENVCRIITFGTLAARQVVKDVGRCLGETPTYTQQLANLIPKGVKVTIADAMKENPMLVERYNNEPRVKKIIDIGLRLEGNKRHASQHACGLVLSPSIVSDFLPTSMEKDQETKEKSLTSQVIMTEVEELSLIKMDLLGLKNMGVIHEVMDRVMETRGEAEVRKVMGRPTGPIRYQDIPLNDRATYQMLKKGLTGGCFQLESEGMTRLIQDLLWDIDTLPEDRLDECFERLVAAVALYRPGPMDYIPNYTAGMKDPRKINYIVPELESILKPTYGTIVYQEQVMQVVQKLAGFSLGRADLIRKAMGKKKADILAAERNVFIYGNKEAFEKGKDQNYAPGCIANGIPEQAAIEIWDQMANFASYAFNRSHAVCYAFIGVVTAFMACHWTEEFYAAMLNAFIVIHDKTKVYLSQAVDRGIKILMPDVNLSGMHFTAEPGAVRFGLSGISGVKSAGEAIVKEREEHGKFESVQDLYDRMMAVGKMDKKTYEGLVYGGALAQFCTNKNQLLAYLPLLDKNYKTITQQLQDGQMMLFPATVPMPQNVPNFSKSEELRREFEALGVYLSSHPTDEAIHKAKEIGGYDDFERIKTGKVGDYLHLVGMATDVRQFKTSKGEMMLSFRLETRFDSVKCVVFPKHFQDCFSELRNNAVICITGYVQENDRGEETEKEMAVQSVESESVLYNDKQAETMEVFVATKGQRNRVEKYVLEHPGNMIVQIVGPNKSGGTTTITLPNGVEMSAATIEYLSYGYKL